MQGGRIIRILQSLKRGEEGERGNQENLIMTQQKSHDPLPSGDIQYPYSISIRKSEENIISELRVGGLKLQSNALR